jgi:hypothetical protein
MLLGVALSPIVSYFVSNLYETLHLWLPDVFVKFNVVIEKELFLAHQSRMNVFSTLLTLFFTVYLSLRFNNERDEFIISVTDGLFSIKDAIPSYVKRFLVSDIAATVIISNLFAIPITFIPKQFLNTDGTIASFLSQYRLCMESFGEVGMAIFYTLALLILHVPALPLSLKSYRAKLLAGFASV